GLTEADLGEDKAGNGTREGKGVGHAIGAVDSDHTAIGGSIADDSANVGGSGLEIVVGAHIGRIDDLDFTGISDVNAADSSGDDSGGSRGIPGGPGDGIGEGGGNSGQKHKAQAEMGG